MEEVSSPFPELDEHQYRYVVLENGIRALFISSQKRDTVLRRATSKMDTEERKVIAKLLAKDASSSTLGKDLREKRRSTLVNADTFYQQQQEKKSDSGKRTSQRSVGKPESIFKSSHRSLGRKSNVSLRSLGSKEIIDEVSVTATPKTEFSQDFEEAENMRSITLLNSRNSLPGDNSFRRDRSRRLSSAYTGVQQQQFLNQATKEIAVADLSAVAVCVSVGSFSDPSDCQGLAHVVEHMVFMGNEKYPSENDWDTFISSAGGDSNATTESERTSFHFSVPHESFAESVNRFSQFFVRPLLRKESLQRELAAIDSEFNDSEGDISCCLAEVASATARHGPFSNFACGNSKTLKSNPNLHDYVTEFFFTHYVAPNITVVLLSSDSLNQIEAVCKQNFLQIPTSREIDFVAKRNFVKFSPSLPPFTSEGEVPGEDGNCLGCIVVCDPEKRQPNVHTLQVSWQLPCQRKNWRTKPLRYISSAISQETQNSIFYYLKNRGWVNALFAGDGTFTSGLESNSISTLFSIYLLLTDDGLLNWESVIGYVFEYIGLLQRQGVSESYFNELQKCEYTKFFLKEFSNPAGMVESYCQRLCTVSEIPPSHICNGVDLLFDWNPDLIHEILAMLSPNNCRIDIVSSLSELGSPDAPRNMNNHRIKKKVFVPLIKLSPEIKKERWYETKYCVLKIPKKMLMKWNINFSSNGKTFVHLPKPNTYISDDFEIKPKPNRMDMDVENAGYYDYEGKIGSVELIDSECTLLSMHDSGARVWIRSSTLQQKINHPENVNYASEVVAPALLQVSRKSNSNRLYMWHLQNGNFRTSQMNLTLLFKFKIPPTPLNSALLGLEDVISFERYSSSLSGTQLSIKAENMGVKFIFIGLPQTILLLCERILPLFLEAASKGIYHFKTVSSIDSQLQILLNRFENDDCALVETLNGILYFNDHLPPDKQAALEQCPNVELKLDSFARSALTSCICVGLAYGNISLQESISLEANLGKFFDELPAIKDVSRYFEPKSMLKIPQTSNLMGTSSVFITSARSSSVLVFFQTGNLLLCQFMAQLLKEPLFNTLRTKRQLAYYAHVCSHPCGGVLIEVSSHHTGTFALIQNIDQFLYEFSKEILIPMSNIDFQRHIRALELKKLEKDAGPTEEAKRHFETILKGLENSFEFDWNSQTNETEFVRNLSRSVVSDFFNKHLHPDSLERRKLTLVVKGLEELSPSPHKFSTLAQVKEELLENERIGTTKKWFLPSFLHRFGSS